MFKKFNYRVGFHTNHLFYGLTLAVTLLFSSTVVAQRVTNIDAKGTKLTTGNIVTPGDTAPSPTDPVPPIQGDIWIDTTDATNIIPKVWDGDSWESLDASDTGITTGTGAPTTANPDAGDIYVDESTGDIYTSDGTEWTQQNTAGNVVYDNTTSGLTATDVQAAIDELGSPLSKTVLFSAEYAGASLQADASDNELNIISGNSGSPDYMNYYMAYNIELTSGGGTENDYDIILRFALPSDFHSWEDATGAIVIDYEGTVDSKVEVDVYEAGAGIVQNNRATSGAGATGFSSLTVATASQLTTLATGGKIVVLVIKLTVADAASAGDSFMRVGDIRVRYKVQP